MRLRGRLRPGSDSEAGRPAPHVGDEAPPRGVPVASYAAVLDGRHLWVAVEERPGHLALRVSGSGGPLATGEPVQSPQQPGYLSAVLPLDALPESATYDVVVAPGEGGQPAPVWTSHVPEVHVAPAPDARSRAVLARSPDGTLQVRREPLPDAVVLLGVSARPDGLVLETSDPRAPVVLTGDDGPVASFDPVDGSVLLTSEALEGVSPQQTRVLAGSAPDARPVRRRDDDLTGPGRGAPLPELRDAATGLPRLRLRWDRSGLLQARLVEGEDDT